MADGEDDFAGHRGKEDVGSDAIMSDDEPDDPGAESRSEHVRAWNAVSLMLSGLVFWGGIGWLVAQWLDNQLFMLGGILLGVGLALYLVWIRYGRA